MKQTFVHLQSAKSLRISHVVVGAPFAGLLRVSSRCHVDILAETPNVKNVSAVKKKKKKDEAGFVDPVKI